MNEPDRDAALLRDVAKGDASAAREMVARKLPRLLSLATRILGDQHEARDVAQDAFLRIWSEASRWQPGGAKFDTWLHRVVLNLCYDRLRQRHHHDLRPWDEFAEAEMNNALDSGAMQPERPPETRLMEREQQERVKKAIAALPSRQRDALLLQYYQEMSNVEAAKVLDVSVEALESLLARARRTLRDHLAGERTMSEKMGQEYRPAYQFRHQPENLPNQPAQQTHQSSLNDAVGEKDSL